MVGAASRSSRSQLSNLRCGLNMLISPELILSGISVQQAMEMCGDPGKLCAEALAKLTEMGINLDRVAIGSTVQVHDLSGSQLQIRTFQEDLNRCRVAMNVQRLVQEACNLPCYKKIHAVRNHKAMEERAICRPRIKGDWKKTFHSRALFWLQEENLIVLVCNEDVVAKQAELWASGLKNIDQEGVEAMLYWYPEKLPNGENEVKLTLAVDMPYGVDRQSCPCMTTIKAKRQRIESDDSE